MCDIAGAQPLTTHPTDHFSAHAQNYARFRPTYPTELFAWLASQSPGHRLAWDCGTGNGQAALGLADHFVHVHATDLSPQQLAQARALAKDNPAAVANMVRTMINGAEATT